MSIRQFVLSTEVAQMRAVVAMNAAGRLTVPRSARDELGLEGEAQFQLEVRDGDLVLRPAAVVPREDAWAYTPEHRERLARAREDSRLGRVRQLTEQDLDDLAGE